MGKFKMVNYNLGFIIGLILVMILYILGDKKRRKGSYWIYQPGKR